MSRTRSPGFRSKSPSTNWRCATTSGVAYIVSIQGGLFFVEIQNRHTTRNIYDVDSPDSEGETCISSPASDETFRLMNCAARSPITTHGAHGVGRGDSGQDRRRTVREAMPHFAFRIVTRIGQFDWSPSGRLRPIRMMGLTE